MASDRVIQRETLRLQVALVAGSENGVVAALKKGAPYDTSLLFWAVKNNFFNVISTIATTRASLSSDVFALACKSNNTYMCKLLLEKFDVDAYVFGRGVDLAIENECSNTVKAVSEFVTTRASNNHEFVAILSSALKKQTL
jgi:hypothetical protein